MHRLAKVSDRKLSSILQRRFGAVLGVGFAALLITAAFIALPSRPTQAAPYFGCSPNGYIFKYQASPNTAVQAVDMVTGLGSSAGTLTARNFNAVGYNPKDNYFYGWDLTGGGTFMRVKSDFATSAESLTISGYAGPTTNIFSGDVDEDGYYWFFTVGGTTTWHRINLNTATPTFVETGSTANPTGSEGTDWAYVPGTNKLYRGMDNGTNITIVAFDRTSKTYSTAGVVSNITAAADRNMGAVYADPDGNFYMSSHQSGKLWRVDLTGPAPYTAVELGAADPQSNDGARCSLASIPVDFGDAPNSYLTFIASDGPRHSIANFDVNTSTAPLMLGTRIDIEVDGLPGAQAKGDDADHQGLAGSGYIDDERGVTNIIATPGVPTALTVPVKVTNNSAAPATLAGWIDLDADGTFETGERVTAAIDANSGTATYELSFPSTTFNTNTYARFRLFTDTVANPLPSGAVAVGEVEDVLVQVGSYSANKTANPAEGSTVDPGQTVTYTVTIQNTGATALANLKVDDDLADVLDDATVEGSPTVTPSSAGTASIIGSVLEYVGDIAVGQSVTVTYAVKIKDAGALGSSNASLQNTILAAHSTNCHPVVSSGSATAGGPDCQTTHAVAGLANTGSNQVLPVVLGTTLIAAALYLGQKQRHTARPAGG